MLQSAKTMMPLALERRCGSKGDVGLLGLGSHSGQEENTLLGMSGWAVEV